MKIKVDLSGPEGNAFAIISRVEALCIKLNKDFKVIVDKLKNGPRNSKTYEQFLIEVVEEELGDYIEFI